MKPVIRLPHVVENESLRKRGRALSASHGHLQWMYQERCAEVESLTASLGLARKEAEKHAAEVKRLAGERAAEAKRHEDTKPSMDAAFEAITTRDEKQRNEIKGLKKELDASTDALLEERTRKLALQASVNDLREMVKTRDAVVERLSKEAESLKKAKAENDERFMTERDKARADAGVLSEAIEKALKALREIDITGRIDVVGACIDEALSILNPCEYEDAAIFTTITPQRGPVVDALKEFVGGFATAIQSSVSATPTASQSSLNEGPRCPPPCNKLLDAQEISDGRTSCTKCSPVMLKPSKQAEERRAGRTSP